MNISATEMTALTYDGALRVVKVPKTQRSEGEILIRVTKAGICNTDHEIIRGYVPGFNGIPGHEFIGTVEEADDASLLGKRCTSEINCACGSCEYCKKGFGRHCPDRTVLGIINRNGAFAEYISVPEENLVVIPDTIPDNRAIFIEPLAAALEILDQVTINNNSNVLLLGDGKLGTLIAHVLAATGCHLTLVGKHAHKIALIDYDNVSAFLLDDFQDSKFDIVIEATGNSSAFERAINNTKPRGTVVLKSTYAGGFNFNPSPIVVNEISIIGSRCGRFPSAIDFLSKNDIALEKLISREFMIQDALEAFDYSSREETLKVVLNMQH